MFLENFKVNIHVGTVDLSYVTIENVATFTCMINVKFIIEVSL